MHQRGRASQKLIFAQTPELWSTRPQITSLSPAAGKASKSYGGGIVLVLVWFPWAFVSLEIGRGLHLFKFMWTEFCIILYLYGEMCFPLRPVIISGTRLCIKFRARRNANEFQEHLSCLYSPGRAANRPHCLVSFTTKASCSENIFFS